MKTFFAAMLAVLFSVAPAQASIITIDFEDQTPGLYTENLTIGNFRFSPNFHYDLVSGIPQFPGQHQSQWIGFDGAGPRPNNPNFLGTTGLPPSLWVDYSATPFSLVGLLPVDLPAGGRPTWELTSSNGGFFSVPFGSPTHANFSGPAWTNISWLLFTDRQSAGRPSGFDDISFLVQEPTTLPEPGSLLLVGLGLVLVAGARRRHRSQ